MHCRREWLENLLEIQRDLQAKGHEIELISEEELHEIRKEWLNDPNEPDWLDELPAIYHRVFNRDLDWAEDDSGTFGELDIETLKALEKKHHVPATLVRKLLDLEISVDGLAMRRRITDRIHGILSEDWLPLAELLARGQSVRDGGYQEEIKQLQSELDEFADKTDP